MNRLLHETTIELGPDDAALVVRADGSLDMFMPNINPESVPPQSFLAVGVVSYLLTSPTRQAKRLLRHVCEMYKTASQR